MPVNETQDFIKCAAWNMRSLSLGSLYLRELMLENDIIAVSEHGAYSCQLWKLDQVNSNFRAISKSSRSLNDKDCNIKVGIVVLLYSGEHPSINT